jgi:hypothetical protein
VNEEILSKLVSIHDEVIDLEREVATHQHSLEGKEDKIKTEIGAIKVALDFLKERVERS